MGDGDKDTSHIPTKHGKHEKEDTKENEKENKNENEKHWWDDCDFKNKPAEAWETLWKELHVVTADELGLFGCCL